MAYLWQGDFLGQVNWLSTPISVSPFTFTNCFKRSFVNTTILFFSLRMIQIKEMVVCKLVSSHSRLTLLLMTNYFYNLTRQMQFAAPWITSAEKPPLVTHATWRINYHKWFGKPFFSQNLAADCVLWSLPPCWTYGCTENGAKLIYIISNVHCTCSLRLFGARFRSLLFSLFLSSCFSLVQTLLISLSETPQVSKLALFSCESAQREVLHFSMHSYHLRDTNSNSVLSIESIPYTVYCILWALVLFFVTFCSSTLLLATCCTHNSMRQQRRWQCDWRPSNVDRRRTLGQEAEKRGKNHLFDESVRKKY